MIPWQPLRRSPAGRSHGKPCCRGGGCAHSGSCSRDWTLPGVRELLVEADRAGVPCAVASSSQRSHVQSWLDRTGIGGAFSVICTRDDAAGAKPAPELFLAAAEALGLDPGGTLVLEDSANGLRAARAVVRHA